MGEKLIWSRDQAVKRIFRFSTAWVRVKVGIKANVRIKG